MERLPKFKSAQEEGDFWETHSPLDFVEEFEEVKEPIVDRRGRKKGIYIRVDPEAIELARSIGAELGLGYQTLFRMWIMEGLGRYLARTGGDPVAAVIYRHVAGTFMRLEPGQREVILRRFELAQAALADDPEPRFSSLSDKYS